MLNLIVPIVLALAEFFRWQGRRAGRETLQDSRREDAPGGISVASQAPHGRDV